MDGQLLLKNAKVLVVGTGGLGCPVLQYLTAAGVGKIGILDFDVVDESNLQRQVLFDTNDIGDYKADVAAKKLSLQNPHVQFDIINQKIDSNNAVEIVEPYDIIVDGSDNFQTRYLMNDISVLLNKVLVHGSIFKFDGQVSVFNLNGGPTYRCLFPSPPVAGSVPSCSQIGVIGVLPGIIGSLMAAEVIKVITGIGEPLTGKLLTFDALTMTSQVIKFRKNTEIVITDLIDYDSFCGSNSSDIEVPTLSVDKLNDLILSQAAIQLIDVREGHEVKVCQLENSIHIPLSELLKSINKLSRDQKVVVYCHFGNRSKEAVKMLIDDYGFNNIYSLEGGIDDWAMEIDNSIVRY